jgi:hypothetical protein
MTKHLRSTAVALAALSLAAGALTAQASPCAGRANCTAVPSFVATITDFRTSTQDRTRLVTATVRFENRTDRPLRLAYVQGSGLVTDDQGNRYVVYGAEAVRGMGEVNARAFDPKFVLQPGEGSDARFELMWRPGGNEIHGTSYDLELAVREIEPLPASQFRLGREHALHFRALGGAAATVASAAATPATPVAATTAAPAMPAADPCAGAANCYGAGPFTAQVTRLQASRLGDNTGDHLLHLTVRFRNVTDAPVILAYKASSSLAIDDLGNRYYWGRAGTHDVSMKGMGLAEGRGVDPQFVLQPGEARDASWDVRRFRTGRNQVGTSWSYDLAILQLEPLPANQVRVAREHSISFPGLTEGTTAAADAALPTGTVVPADAVDKAVDKAATRAKGFLDRMRAKSKKPPR